MSQNELDPVFVTVRSLSLTLVVIGGLFMAGSLRNLARSWLGWGLCLAITVVTGSRMASLAMLALPILNPVTRHLFLKVAAVAVVVVLGIALVSTTAFQERFFHGGSGGISDILAGDLEMFDSSGRFDAWPQLLDEALKRPWFGHGVGSVHVYLPSVWEDIAHPHNDYLRLLYEQGFIGLGLFLWAVLWQLWTLKREVRRTTGVVQQAFGAAWLGLLVFLMIAATDNPIVYHVWYMNPVFALMGAACAVAREEENESRLQDHLPADESGTQARDTSCESDKEHHVAPV
jgi:O-antigen ligase